MDTMEPIECGVTQRKSRCHSSETERSSPVSTSYGGSSQSPRDNGGTSSCSDARDERERKSKGERNGQSRRLLQASPGSWKIPEKTETQDRELNGSDRVEITSPSFKQDRKQQKARHSLASKVCSSRKHAEILPAESEAIGGEDEDDLSNYRTFERLVQLSELQEEVSLLHKRLAEELELRAVLESALEHDSGALTKFPRHLPISARELLANITLLEVAVLKLEEQSSLLQDEVGQARIEREIAELRYSSAHGVRLRSEGLSLNCASSDSNEVLRDDHSVRLSSTVPSCEGQKSNTASSSTPTETTSLQSCMSLRQEPQFKEQPQKGWKEQRALTLRQDLRLTIPEFSEEDHATVSPWSMHHEYDSISDRQSQIIKSFWKRNPLEEEDHWIPLIEHEPQVLFAEAYCDSPQDSNMGLCHVPVASVTHNEDSPCFSPAIIAETLRPLSPDLADLAEEDDKSFIPVAEVLWKPSTVKPSTFSNDLETEIPTIAVLTTKPESWSFTSEDDHPRPESGSAPHSMVFEDQPWAQLAEAPSVDEQKTKYRNGVMNVRELRRQGTLDKNSEKTKSFDSSRTSSISSVKSGTLLSPIWSPVDTRTENRNAYESRGSVEMENGCNLALSFNTPNELSEQMVRCMISIYRHLADSNNTNKESSPLGKTQSPTSPFTATTNLSASVSESSLLSVIRSPLVDLRSKEVLGNEASPDPFKSRGKIPWADIGPYAHAMEVGWLSVGKDQLEFAAQALRSFKILVEQLSRVDPSNLKHEEKLAFWINLYNALLMHAYLAYGIPKSDLKFFALLQKAAYTVGGHSFNAATMEFCLLRSKSTAHRPQLNLLMSLHKNKLTEDQSKFGIDHLESLVSFGLCSGTRSSPMVRVYTAKHVKSQLEDALHDYTRAAVGISAKGRLLVPKLLYTYAREHVEDADLLDWVCNFLPSNQVAVVFEVIQQRRHRILGSKNFNVLPNDFTFRYLFPAEVCPKREF
ncbi:uncharacterized protein [Physcomitrium patens]|uniref:DUF547 domain-containing protein n=1 Tax=Physcomitrium patens TaxID=3218 RepID=A0A2K1KT94_PHYPA|nr:uncharacterized protein LOC112279911 [Physcomitrium patens]XP_024370433.1 uncharacterized protein LOC112279911 [Physcomitrium patens]PNR56980.1 hypothetical protein PHYPA_003973 [Physcomitrium patens]|eukprot:XP_024370432.1 uncharacterized protein LOC112279911 [Physcomitrella patens]